MDPIFAAAPLVEFLRGQLWRAKPGRAAGRASVMIGAGFSRNADSSASAARPFLTWQGLADGLARDLDPAAHSRDPMRVAQEYEAMFGRARLDEAIRSLVPDNDHRPSDLHRRLLALPWADIFSTNWDTLLERACPDAHERAYDLVTTLSQLPSAALPRIVKLHGTLPANGPFILTEEDFRTYPRRFAPFVNMVQQAMMETSMVLLGFSGDDPNFLEWSGWVRDNLGEHAPPIYLVGWLALPPQRRRMLEERRVIPIDLSALPDARAWPEEARHRWAVEWFLHAMEGGRPPRLMAWPYGVSDAVASAAHLGWTMAARAQATSADLWPKAALNVSAEVLVAEFRTLLEAWRAERKAYPGWWIVPHAVREAIWSRSWQWLADASRRIGLIPISERLGALAEVLRRLDMCLLDAEIISELPMQLEGVLASVSPDGARWAVDGAEGALDLSAREDWRVCLLASARLARAHGDQSLHAARLATLGSHSRADPTASDEATFERALWNAKLLEDDELDRVLDAWDTSGSDPTWGIRKAGLLAGAGRGGEARSEIVSALGRARRNRRADLLDLPALSREGWGLVLGVAWQWSHIAHADGVAQVVERDPWGRWEDLRPYGCDGWSDVLDLKAAMREPPPPPERERVRGFEPGATSETIHFRAGLADAYRAGRQMLRLADMTALPSAANNTNILREVLERAVEACAPYDAKVPLILLLAQVSGAGDDKALHRYLTRARVATLSDNEVGALVAATMRRITVARKRADLERVNGVWLSRFRAAVEVLSRLMPRCSDEQARAAFSLACDTAQNGWSASHMFAGTEIWHLFSRSVARLPDQDLPAALARVAALPFPDARWARSTPGVGDPVNAFAHRTRELKAAIARDGMQPDAALAGMLASSARSTLSSRKLVAERLLMLDQIGLLAPAGRESLAELLWGNEDAASARLPADLGFHPWAFLTMPERYAGQAAAAFRREFLDGRREQQLGNALWNVAHGLEQSRLRGKPFTMTEQDISALAALAIDWAQLPIADREPAFAASRDDEDLAHEGLARALTLVRLPNEALAAVREKVSLLQAGPVRRLSGLRMVGGLATADKGFVVIAAGWLRRGLVSADPGIAGEAVRGLYFWLAALRDSPGDAEPPDDLVEEVAGMLTARRPGTVERALEFFKWLFDEGPARLHLGLTSRCDLALSYLLDETSYDNEVLAGHRAELDAPLLRQRAMALAGAMRRAGHGNGEGVRRWLEAGVLDPLFEVRRAADQGAID